MPLIIGAMSLCAIAVSRWVEAVCVWGGGALGRGRGLAVSPDDSAVWCIASSATSCSGQDTDQVDICMTL